MSPTAKLLFATTWLKYRRFIRDTRDPEGARQRSWRRISSEIRGGPFWRERLLGAALPPLSEFDLSTYETYAHAVQESFRTGTSQLSGRPVIFWAESGGTTGTPKIFPVTEAYRREFQTTTPPFLHSLLRRFPGLLRHPVLYFASTQPAAKSPTGVDVGFISGFNYRNIPRAAQRSYAFPLAVFRDAGTFFEWGPLYALATDLSAMFAITPSMLSRFAETIMDRVGSLWPYLEGRRQPPAPLPPLRIAPGRAALLRGALRERPFSFRRVWPGLRVICCWTGATCALQLPRLRTFLHDEVPVVETTYSATEGFLSVPLDDDHPGGVLHPGGHIVEFMKAGEAPGRQGLLPAWGLLPGQDYEVVLTTAMGLVRYCLRDIVRCTGYFNRAPIIDFVGKADSTLSLGQARISETQIMEAMAGTGLRPAGRWFFGPGLNGDQLVFYCDADTEPEAWRAQVLALDEALRRSNRYYDMDVRAGLLRPMAVLQLPAAHPVWAAWAGPDHAQAKPRVLVQAPPGR